MSIRLIATVFDSRLPPIPRLLMLAVADRAADDGSRYFESQKTLAAKTGLSVKTVSRWMKWLTHEAHLLEMVAEADIPRHRAAEYRVNLERLNDYRSRKRAHGRPVTAPIRIRRVHNLPPATIKLFSQD